MDLRVIGLLLLIPLLDVVLLVAIATQIGPVLTVAIVVLTAFIGLLLARAEGRHTLGKIQEKLAVGEPPTDELLDGGLLLIAGALMLTPGLVTDAIGLILVLPPTRYPIRLATKKYVVKPYADSKTGGFASGNVYIGGFPNQGDGDGAGPFQGQGFPGGAGPGHGGPGGGGGADGAAGGGGAAGPGGGGGDASDTDGDAVEIGEDDYRFSDVHEDASESDDDAGT